MTPLASTTMRVLRCRDMQRLRLQADLAQLWRRRLATSGGPAAWVQFKSMYDGAIDDARRELAGRIRRLRHQSGLGPRPSWVAQ